MGVDPLTIGLLASAGGSIYGAYQNSKNQQNTAQQYNDRSAAIQGYVNQFLQPGANPYSSAIMQFLGRGPVTPTSAAGLGGSVYPGSYVTVNYGGQQMTPQQYQQIMQNGGIPPGNGSGGGGAYPSGGGGGSGGYDPTQLTPNMEMSVPNQYQAVMPGTYQPSVPGYTGGFHPAYPNVGGVDLSQYMGQGLRFSDLVNQGILTQAQVNQFWGQPADYDPMSDPNVTSQYNDYVNSMKTVTGANQSQIPDLQTWYNTMAIGGTNLDTYAANDNNALEAALANIRAKQANTPIPTMDPSQARYLQGGILRDGNGNLIPGQPNIGLAPVAGGQNTYSLPSNVAQGGGIAGGQPIGAPIGASGSMYQYQPISPYTYNPALTGPAPTMEASLVGGAPTVSAPTVGTQSFNAGQDALLQAMRADPLSKIPGQQGLDTNLAAMASGKNMFNNSDLFSALNQQDNTNINNQVAALHASAGSLGERFGTAMNANEATLRANALNNIAVRNGQLASQSYESAQQRALSALGQQVGLQGQNQNYALAGANYGLNAAQAAAQSLFGTQNLNSQIGLANAANQLQASGQNAQLLQQVALANQSAQQAARQANLGVASQYGLANQSALNAAGQFNAAQATQNNQFNAAQGNQYNNLFLQAISQAAGLQNSSNGFNAQLLGLLAGLPIAPTPSSPWASTIGDIGQLAMLYPFLQQMRNS